MFVMGVDHIGIAVDNLEEAVELYNTLGLELEGINIVEDQEVRVAFFSTGGETRIELLEPTETESTIAKFIERHGEGVHHIAFEVRDIEAVLRKLRDGGLKLVDEQPRTGVGGAKIAFINPKSTRRVLYELCEKP
jgi:methylmalonyl-CoA/ethylmalonyl-CoA epimerase